MARTVEADPHEFRVLRTAYGWALVGAVRPAEASALLAQWHRDGFRRTSPEIGKLLAAQHGAPCWAVVASLDEEKDWMDALTQGE